MGNILENFKNVFGKSWKNLGKLRETFWKVSRNIAEILEKYFKNFEYYIVNVRTSYQKILEYFEEYFEHIRDVPFQKILKIFPKESFE